MEDGAPPSTDPIEPEVDAAGNDPVDAAVAGSDVKLPADEDMDEVMEEEIGVEKDITGDGGVVKKILVKGTGWASPDTEDQVEVHYVGTLEDGTQFDSSRDRGEPFSFKLGVGSVIKAWDCGVATMKKGEKSILTCRGDYAYGEKGSPPKIPPNAVLKFEVELLGWKNSKDISPDNNGGIIKTIVSEGKDWANPGKRDEVLVRYTAWVEGAEEPFVTTPESGVEFTLGDGHFVAALPIALEAMKKQEKVSLLVQPEFGLGEAGQPPAVPPNATLKIDLELVSWKKVEDVTDDGKVVKKTIAEGKETWKRPNEGATVTIKYTGRLPDSTVFDQQESRTFCMDDGEVPVGLEDAVSKMHQGEQAVVTVAPEYAYGEAGHSGLLAPVPPNTTVTYEVELVSLQNFKELFEIHDDEEKLSTSLLVKEKGNTAFKAGNNGRAVKLYKRAIKFVDGDKAKLVSGELRSAFRDARKSAFLNLAAAQLKLKENKETIQSCEKVLEVDSLCIKALYRMAQAHMNEGDYVEAELAIKRGLVVEERNPDLLALQKKLKVMAREQNQRESKMFARMFAPSKGSHAASEPHKEGADPAGAPSSEAVDVPLESTADKPDDPPTSSEEVPANVAVDTTAAN